MKVKKYPTPLSKKIGVISTMEGAPWGGSEELWAALVREALGAGIHVGISIRRWPQTPPQILDLQQRGACISWRYPSNAAGPGSIFRRTLTETLRSLPFHLHMIGRSAARLSLSFHEIFHFKPDVVCISQGWPYDAVYFPDLVSLLYVSSTPYVVVCEFVDDTSILDEVTRNAAREFFSRAFQVVFVSRTNLKTIERQLAVKIPNAVVLQNPVNLDDLSPVPWPESPVVKMASVARLETQYKGQDILLEALSTEVWKQRDWRLRLYGEGADRHYLQDLAKHYGLFERVQFAGHVTAVREIWSDNHILALPSRAEGTPLALVETMVCGRPAVVTNVGGNVEWIEEQQTGFIADASTAISFAAALERAWQARAHWRDMGNRAHNKALKRIDPSPGKSLLKVVLGTAA